MSSNLNEKRNETCRVCGESKSAGWHCGTITCEACKKFFLRNINGENEFKCIRSQASNQGNCVITKKTRTTCGYCRFQKCLQVGMKTNEKVTNEAVSFKNIPCTVCMASSSGLHFGAITCEGCKGFFRRNFEIGSKFVCTGTGNGNCEIHYNNRNACRACRLKRCFEVGMDLKNCKIGRQSNLFKQKLKQVMDDKSPNGGHTASTSNTDLTSGSLSSSSATNLDQLDFPATLVTLDTSENLSTLVVSDLDSFGITGNLNTEDQMDEPARDLVRAVLQAYSMFNFNELSDLMQPNKMINDHELALEFLNLHASNCAKFLSSIPIFRNLNSQDQRDLLLNAMHPMRLMQVINDSQYLNYFNCEPLKYEKIIKYFPIFDKIKDCLKNLSERIREFKLDNKETALYIAYLAVITFKSTNMSTQVMVRLELAGIMAEYMNLRRNETESVEQLIELSFEFGKINLFLQRGIHESIMNLKSIGYSIHPAYENITYTPVVARSYSSI